MFYVNANTNTDGEKYNIIANKAIFKLIWILICISISAVKSQVCGPKEPVRIKDCLDSSSDDNKCCFSRVSNKNKLTLERSDYKSMCLFIPINQTFITPYITQMDLGVKSDLVDITIDCGEDLSKSDGLYKCGGGDFPTSFEDCNKYSTNSTSCCYMSSYDKTSACFLNPSPVKYNETVFGINIECGGGGFFGSGFLERGFNFLRGGNGYLNTREIVFKLNLFFNAILILIIVL